jgi:hypothetical protein
MAAQPSAEAHRCPQCGVAMAASARFCATCGHLITHRSSPPPAAAPPPVAVTQGPTGGDEIRLAGRGVRCSAALLDLAAMMSPALPLSIAAAVLGVAEIVYIVLPVAFAAVWVWLQVWQGLTGTTFGKSMLGLRLVRAGDLRAPGFAATMTRSGIFFATLGLAARSVLASRTAVSGSHDRASGLVVIDVTQGANPLGARQLTTLRRSVDRGLNRVQSPVPVTSPRRG